MFSQDDDNQGMVLGVVFALIALVIVLVLGVGIYQSRLAAPPAPVIAVPVQLANGASIQVMDGVVKFYFASGKAEVAAGANEALADVVRAVAAGKKVMVSGFHDASGDPALNAELAKQRAFAVRDALLALGVTEDKIELIKPDDSLAPGSDSEARRVEVKAQ
jgi:outer membrane protein OmpA-like peptidoglycan-associated protein